MSERINIDYGVILPTWPKWTVVVKPVGEDRLLVFSGDVANGEGMPTSRNVGPCEWDLWDLPPMPESGEDRRDGEASVD